MKRSLQLFVIAAALAATAAVLSAQLSVPEIQFDSNADLLKFPDNIHMGEAAGVATNSKGDVFLYTRAGNPSITLGTSRAVSHGGSRLFQFDRTGKFVREIGQGAYGLLQAQQVRVDPQDNVWIVDQMSTQVIKFDPNGRVADGAEPQAGGDAGSDSAVDSSGDRSPCRPDPTRATGCRRSRRRAGRRGRGAGPGGAPPAAGAPGGGGGGGGGGAAAADCPARAPRARASSGRLTSRGTPPATSTWPTGTATRESPSTNRPASTSSRGGRGEPAPGQFNIVHGIAIDAQGNVYVADEGNRRVQVFDREGTFKKQFLNVGTPTAICVTPGPRQYLYVAHTGDPDGMEDAAIYKVDLDGKIVGKFGRAGKQVKEFGLVNSIDCRNENELLIGELSNWRVQKLTLRAAR